MQFFELLMDAQRRLKSNKPKVFALNVADKASPVVIKIWNMIRQHIVSVLRAGLFKYFTTKMNF